jgi:hypothetical protein
MKMSVRRIGLASLGKMGCLLGIVAAFVPSLLCGLVATGAAVTLRRWLESWQEAAIRLDLPLIGEQLFSFDLVGLLSLEELLSFLDAVTAASFVTLALIVLALALASGLFLAAIVMLVGLAYNLLAPTTGGVVVEMKPVADQESQPAKAPLEPPATG